MVELSRETLTGRADLIVRAKVASQRFSWNEDHSQILTLTELTITQYVKGAGPERLTLRQFGGTIDGLTERVPGDAHLEPGQEAVLFLKKGAQVVYLSALSQSAYLIKAGRGGEPTVSRPDLGEASFLVPGHKAPVAVLAEPPETLSHLLADLTVRQKGARP
jgi:hypothetical protein